MFRSLLMPFRRHPVLAGLAVLILTLGSVPLVASWSFFLRMEGWKLTVPGPLMHIYPQREDGSGHPLSWEVARQLPGRCAGLSQVIFVVHTWGEQGPDGESLGETYVQPQAAALCGLEVDQGRPLAPSDLEPQAAPVALVGRRFWKAHLGGDPQAIGRVIQVSGQPVQVVGLLARDQSVLGDLELVRPLDLAHPPGPPSLLVRLAPGWDAARLREELRRISAQLQPLDPELGHLAFLKPFPVDSKLSLKILALLLGGGLPCFLVACLAVVALLLAMGAERLPELALRSALGASRRRLLAEALAPAGVLGLLSAALAWAPALWLTASLPSLLLGPLAVLPEQALGWPDFIGVLSVGLLAALGAGLWPAWRASHLDPARLVARGSAVTSRTSGLHRVLVTGQVAAALALLGGAGLVWNHQQRQAACQPYPFWRELVRVVPRGRGLKTGELEARLRTLAGVRSLTRDFAFWPGLLHRDRIRISGQTPWIRATQHKGDRAWAELRGLRILAGQMPEPGEVALDQSLAGRLFPATSPLGQRIELQGTERPRICTVAGVLENSHSPDQPGRPMDLVLEPSNGSPSFLVRLEDAGPEGLQRFRTQLSGAFPGSRFFVESAREDLWRATLKARLLAQLLLGMGLSAVLVALAGIAGLQSHLVLRRTREFGVRRALGADPRRLVLQVMQESLRLSLWGLPLGLLGTFVLGRLLVLRFELQGFQEVHAPSLLLLALAFPFVMLLASLPAALFALRANPAEALRSE